MFSTGYILNKNDFGRLNRPAYFTLPRQFDITEKNYKILLQRYHQSLDRHDYLKACAFAQKMTIEHGLRGLILYLSAKVSHLTELANTHKIEEILNDVSDTYAYFLIAESLLNSADTASSMKDHNLDLSQLKSTLSNLINIEEHYGDILSKANSIAKTCGFKVTIHPDFERSKTNHTSFKNLGYI